jgi:hypothetical protein
MPAQSGNENFAGNRAPPPVPVYQKIMNSQHAREHAVRQLFH